MFISYEKESKPKKKQEKAYHVITEVRTVAAEESVKTGAFFERSAVAPALVMLFVAFAMSSVMSFLPLYAISKNIINIGVFLQYMRQHC